MKIRTNKIIITLAAALSAVAVLSACDDSITNNTGSDVQTVATYKKLAECSSKNEGDLYYVKDSGAVYLCSDSVWKKMGATSVNNGADGKDGTSCTVSALKDSSGYDILCGGKKVGTLLNGKDGAKGDQGDKGTKGSDGAKGDAGSSGTTCSAKELSDDSGYELYCDGKLVGTVKNGTKGEKGEAGTACTSKALKDGSGYEISCNGKTVGTITDGTSKDADCTFDDDGNGTVTVKCGDDESYKLPLALCGTTPYDPSKKACIEGELVLKK